MATLDYLEGNKKHPSTQDIDKAVLETFPAMFSATVYNSLSALKKHGSLLGLTIGSDKNRFDLGASPYHHLT
jgi:Fur family peroxide stress response transcriptional regulator